MKLDGKIALVTGGSRGIGKAISHKLASEGAYVIATATSENGASAITQAFEEAGLNGEGLCLNVSLIDDIEAFAKTLQSREKTPDILVNNAGITRDNLFLRMDNEEWDAVIQTNLSSVFRMSKAFIRAMFKKRWGRVISISSVVGNTGNAGQANYSAAKSGLEGFTKSIAQEVASRGITANLVAPGFIDTDMTQALPDMVREEILKKVPMKKLGATDDIANAVLFLASDEAKYITGETIHVNGGMYMA